MSETSLCVVGSVNLDFIIKTPDLPRAGETVVGGTLTTLPGGKGANVAVMAARLGAAVSLQAAVGDDDHARAALANARAEGVDLSGMVVLPDSVTGTAFITVDDAGENQIAVASGANLNFTPEHLRPIQAGAVLAQFEVAPDVVQRAFTGARGAIRILNASPSGFDLTPFLPITDVLIVNAGERAAYAQALERFAGRVVVTRGADGAVMLERGREIARAVPPDVDVVDTTGAGDAFAAGLAVALLEGMDDAHALRFACVAGALATTALGTQTAAPRRADVNRIMEQM